MIKVEFNGEAISGEMQGNLAEIMEEFVFGTLGLLDLIWNENAEAGRDARDVLIEMLNEHKSSGASNIKLEKEVQ